MLKNNSGNKKNVFCVHKYIVKKMKKIDVHMRDQLAQILCLGNKYVCIFSYRAGKKVTEQIYECVSCRCEEVEYEILFRIFTYFTVYHALFYAPVRICYRII